MSLRSLCALAVVATGVASAQPGIATTTTLTSSPNPSASGQTVTLTATITASGEVVVPATGNVTFNDGATTLGSSGISNFTAVLNVSALAAGSHSLVATYSGDANYKVSTSAAVTQSVNPPTGTPIAITIASSLANAAFTVSGSGCSPGSYNAPTTLSWPPGGSCTVTITSPQYANGASSPANQFEDPQYVFASWQDGGSANPRTITVPNQASTYTANFNTLYPLQTVASPSAGGTVSGGGYYAPGTVVTVTAMPAAGYHFSAWLNVTSASALSATVTTAKFNAQVIAYFGLNPPVNYTVTQIMTNATAQAINNFGQVVASGLLWTPTQPNGTAGSTTALSMDANSGAAINDYGQVAGTSGSKAFLWQPNSPNATSGTVVSFIGTMPSRATSINSYGEIVGPGYLWVPSSANGTTGTANSDPQFGSPAAINDFGQVALGSTLRTDYYSDTVLFTPFSPHALAGTFTLIAMTASPVGIDNSGSILNLQSSCSGVHCNFAGASLLIPSSANSSTGWSWQPLPWMPPNGGVYAFNNERQVVGIAGYPFSLPFLDIAGTIYDLSGLPGLPAGITTMAINDHGQIVVNANNNVYLLTPQSPLPTLQWTITVNHNGNFTAGQTSALYTINVGNSGTAPVGGTVTVTDSVPYGLTIASASGTGWTCSGNTCTRTDSLAGGAAYPPITVSMNVLAAAPPTVINQATVLGGNATLTASDSTTILGSPPLTPVVVSINPPFSTGSPQSVTFQFSDTSGWQALTVVNVLINGGLDGRQACYLAYSVPNNVLYLVPDSGSGLLPGLLLNGSGSISNSQCTVNGAGSTAIGSGGTLTLTLSLSFPTSFSGYKVVYLAARDTSNNTGWQTMGVYGVPPLPLASSASYMAFDNGSVSSASQAVYLTFSDNSAIARGGFKTGWALINTALDGRAACYIAYYAPANQVFLVPDNGDGSQAVSMTLGGTGSISNRQCTVNGQGSSLLQVGAAELVVILNITVKPAFAGPKVAWMAYQLLDGTTSNWQPLGVWDVPGN